MTPFSDVWPFTDSIPGSFTELSGSKLYEYACQARGVIAEVGVDQGRSASVLFEAANQTGASLILVDSWESVLIDNYYKVLKLRELYPSVIATIHHAKSADAAKQIDVDLDMIHIDAFHYEGGVDVDCQVWLPKLKSGGVACFHDYHSCFPAVTEAVDKYCAGWKDLGDYDGLAIRRKP